ncbi:hypothetical protein DVH24_027356, partial [Malus domestica]
GRSYSILYLTVGFSIQFLILLLYFSWGFGCTITGREREGGCDHFLFLNHSFLNLCQWLLVFVFLLEMERDCLWLLRSWAHVIFTLSFIISTATHFYLYVLQVRFTYCHLDMLVIQYFHRKTNEEGLKTLSFNDKDKIKGKVNSIRLDFLVTEMLLMLLTKVQKHQEAFSDSFKAPLVGFHFLAPIYFLCFGAFEKFQFFVVL